MQCHEGFFLQMTAALRILADCADQAGILFFFPSHACDGALNVNEFHVPPYMGGGLSILFMCISFHADTENMADPLLETFFCISFIG